MGFNRPEWVHQEMVCASCGATTTVDAFPADHFAARWEATEFVCFACLDAGRRPRQLTQRRPTSSSSSAAVGQPSLFEVMERARKASGTSAQRAARESG